MHFERQNTFRKPYLYFLPEKKKLVCVHGTRIPPLMRNSYVRISKNDFFDEQRTITLKSTVQY